MTFVEIQALATYHFQAATTNFELASRMQGHAAETIRERASTHQQFADKLRALVDLEAQTEMPADAMRNALAMQAKVIVAMEAERRDLCAKMAELEMKKVTP